MKNNEAVLITGRISKEDTDKLDSYCEARGLSRSKVVADAVLDRIYSKVCINCGAENNPEGNICSVCGTRLFSDTQIATVFQESCDEKTAKGLMKGIEGEGSIFGGDTDKIFETIYRYTNEGFSLGIAPYINWKSPINERFQYCIYFQTPGGLVVRPEEDLYFTLAPSILLKELITKYPEKEVNKKKE